MNRCPIIYNEFCEDLYSEKGLKRLSPSLKTLGLLNYTAEELRAEAMQRTSKMGLIYSKEHSLTYFIKRFDRKGQKDKVAIEDFAQLAGLSRDTKYNYSMEKLVKLLDDYCTFPAIEKAKLFKLVLFNYLIGNEDMHLKNYSIIIHNGKVELSPAYDLLNTSIVLKGDIEEIIR